MVGDLDPRYDKRGGGVHWLCDLTRAHMTHRYCYLTSSFDAHTWG